MQLMAGCCQSFQCKTARLMRKSAALSNSEASHQLKLTCRSILSTSPQSTKLLQSVEALLRWWSETKSCYGWLQQLVVWGDLVGLPGSNGKKEREREKGEKKRKNRIEGCLEGNAQWNRHNLRDGMRGGVCMRKLMWMCLETWKQGRVILACCPWQLQPEKQPWTGRSKS